MKKILVVEDDVNISNMLCELLTHNEYLPTPSYSGTEALMCFFHEKFDLILLDLMLPGKSGADVLKEIRKTNAVPIIAVTAISEKENIVNLLTMGANDYIVKPFDNGELLARIEVQLRNELPKEVLTFREIVLDLESFEAFIDDKPLQLSKREFEILKLMMQNPKKVFTKNNLYTSVWKNEFLGDDNTINVHISKLRNKIGKIRPNDEYIQTVWGIGFKMQN